MAASEELAAEEQKQKYYVFYCMSCLNILGDSFATARMNKNLKSISLNAVTESVGISQECETSGEGDDRGSTFHILECKHCHRAIGRMYDTTPKKLDCIRDLYTLDWNKVKSYQLGQGTNTSIKPNIQDAELITHSMLLNLNERVNKLEGLVEEVISEDELSENEHDANRYDKKRKIR
ncbi:kinetochore protein mis18-like [Dendronephthya gigantea]|uniref:kinetochore protein mis18-like n=1 Tax=Dendronephthya gigantea TaxID=151771 RepID=UPI00106AF6E2|nr:kinetochore protein mis18-like [Dendronephthya gigantea]